MAKDATMAYRAFTVAKREGADDFWLAIGAAFPHQDGKGLNLILQALPLDGKVVLREPQETEQEQPPPNTNVRGFGNRRGK